MMRKRLVSLVIALLLVGSVAAQESTETPTPEATAEVTETPTLEVTPEVTATVTPDLYAFWTMEPPAESTTGQAVALKYEMTAGGVINAVLLFAIFITLLVMGTIVMLRKTR